jgi:exosortase B
MSRLLSVDSSGFGASDFREQLPLWFGFAAMFLPSYWYAANGLWKEDEHSHAPLVLLVAIWLLWKQLPATAAVAIQKSPNSAWAVLLLGLPIYVVGRILGASSLEFLAHLMVVVAILLFTRGWAHVRLLWFPLVYLVFVIPVPASLIDLVTGPLKQQISSLVTAILASVGYPIARSGVVISVGQYQLLVADACSGLNSMFSLFALGTLFMYLMRRESTVHNVIVFLMIAPIAFIANIVRVIILVLVTYHFGDEAGQGFLHGAAGIFLMLVALALLFCLDLLLTLSLSGKKNAMAPR